jgi:thiamine biosynthesis lipoprotein
MLKVYEYEFKAMGSSCTLNLYAKSKIHFDDVVILCQQELNRLERKYSRFQADSLISQINSASGSEKKFCLDKEFSALLQYANVAYNISDGLFDITSGVLRKVWDFKNKQAPNTQDINKMLMLIGWEKLPTNFTQFSLPLVGMELDFGGIVKEYAADVIAELIRKNKLRHGLVNLGGDIAVVGPHPDQSPWRISISDPSSPNKPISTISLQSGGLASSGDYERYILLEGTKYSHILNPKTGWPVKGFAGVSVWAPKCVMAGTIATTAMLKGQTEGLNWLKETKCQYLAIDQNLKLNLNH